MNFIVELVRVKQLWAHHIIEIKTDILFEVEVSHSNKNLKIDVDNYCLDTNVV